MTFPGVGRAVLTGGSLGGGTGRSTDWTTYDGTNDSAWQQWIDDSSSAISSAHDVTATPMNAHGLNGGQGVLAITDGSVNKVGLFRADTDDATSGQITLYGSHANTGTMRVFGGTVFLTGTDDDGSIVVYSVAGTTLSGGTKISGLYKFYSHDSTYSPPHQGVSVTLSENYPWTGDFNVYSGNNYNYGSADWPANRKTNWLQIWAINPDDSDDARKKNRQFFTPYRISAIGDLTSSPSSALIGRDGSVIGDTSPNYNEDAFKLESHFTGGGTVSHNSETVATHNKDNFIIPFTRNVGDPDFTTSVAGIHNVAFTYASTNSGFGSASDFTPDARVFKFAWVHRRFGALEDQNQTNAGEWYTINGSGDKRVHPQFQTGYNSGRDAAESKVREKMKAIQMGDVFVGLYGDCSSVADIGNLYLTACSGVPSENTHDLPISFEGILADSDTQGSSQSSFSIYGDGGVAKETTKASNNIAVSVTNGSDSSSTAYDPANTALFALDGDYFAVAWTTSSKVYASIFEVQAQTSTAPVITRRADAIDLGNIPAASGTKRVSGMRINTGVGVITCGNYYKIIKTDTI